MVKVFKNNKYEYISLEEYVKDYHNSVNQSWYKYLDLIKEGMNLECIDSESYLKKMNLKNYNSSFVRDKYCALKSSEIAKYFDDEILKYIAHLYELGYFKRIGNPPLSKWLNTKNVFFSNQNLIKQDEGYSIMDLVSLDNGDNAIKNTLLYALKW